ncbi:hypothetical protein K1W69_13770 [Hoeflea sp. WL0058]|uniref:Uncharacterized protein n=1 Tax=Flavimaribacter sediminis TaxID=2865987 RepID=A0AAE3D0Y1_9HYPH|nr:hypothetical protein [Flavimaribacter sediminis]MBW8638259.1 hypothetical protein [Flavimaribacter sediminis]
MAAGLAVAFVALAQSFALKPTAAFDQVDAYGANTVKKLWLVALYQLTHAIDRMTRLR